MSHDDPLASPTLAQLYITQGHYAKAAKVLDVVLDDDPLNGFALALKHRLELRLGARLTAAHEGDRLEVRYELPRGDTAHVHLLVAAWTSPGGHPKAEPVQSIPCSAAKGRLALPLPSGPGSACACLARLDATGAPRVLAVAPVLTW